MPDLSLSEAEKKTVEPTDEWSDAELSDTEPAAQTQTYTVSSESAGLRLDKYLPEVAGLSRAAAVRLTETGLVTLLRGAGTQPSVPDKNTKLKSGDVLTVTVPALNEGEAIPQNIPLDIVYEDDDLLVVNKPVGMVVHPAPGNPDGTLVNALLYHCGDSLSGIGGVKRPGIVHRIDKDTGGLLVVAKNDFTHAGLSEQLKTHTVSRIYTAICIGNMKDDAGTVDIPIGRNPTDRKKMAAFPHGTPSACYTVREAVTHYTVLERYPLGAKWGQSFTLIQCKLETGRTHQIRVHMATLGHPLLGDPLYGGDGTRFGKHHASLIQGQCLFARELDLIHPKTGKAMHFTCDLPAEFAALIHTLREETEKT